MLEKVLEIMALMTEEQLLEYIRILKDEEQASITKDSFERSQ